MSRAKPHSPNAAALAALALLAALLFWNAFHYSWLRGYDAYDNSLYADAISHHRLPTRAEVGVWHTPPLFYVVAASLQRDAEALGWPSDPHRAVQLFSVICVLGIVLLAYLLAREVFPGSRVAPLGALGFAAATPVLVRAGALYHPEPLAALLTVASLYVLVRAASKTTVCRHTQAHVHGYTGTTGRRAARSGAIAGLLLGLANLTRTWALSATVAIVVACALGWLWSRDRGIAITAAMTLGVTAALTVPWLVYKDVRFGSPLAYSQPVPEQWRVSTRPRSFYTSLDLHDVFGSPYVPRYRNHLLPVVYTDWWGDYWRYWDVPLAQSDRVGEPLELTKPLDRERRYQSYLGVLPSLLMGVGLLGLLVTAFWRRSLPLLLLTLPVLFLALAYVGFLMRYPKQDGDNIKALYLLNAAAPLAVCGGWALSKMIRGHRLILAGLALLALELAYLEARFLILPS